MCMAIGRYVLFISNLFFVLAGVALIGLGVAIELPVLRVSDLFDDSLLIQLAPIVAIIAGCFLFVVAFFGCCGAIKESPCMMIFYALLMLFLIALKIALVTLIFVKEEDFLDKIPRLLTEDFIQDPIGFQNIERIFQCCGPLGPASYLNVTLPPSCCYSSVCTILNAYNGCHVVIENFFYAVGLATGIFTIIVMAVEFLVVVSSCCLARNFRSEKKRTFA